MKKGIYLGLAILSVIACSDDVEPQIKPRQDVTTSSDTGGDVVESDVTTTDVKSSEFPAPILTSAVRSGSSYILSFTEPEGVKPEGGYDTFVNEKDLNDSAEHTGLRRTINGLSARIEQCFSLEARYTEAAQFPKSNEICVPGETTSGKQLAFPTASGAGAYATGGRGFPVYFVTNLNDDGDGSMRQALADARGNGGGNIVFRVSGIIDLQANMRTGIENLTIYGQSAPVGGIALSSTRVGGGQQEFGFWQFSGKNSSNIIMRYMTVRPNLEAYPNDCCDAFSMTFAGNYIIDHSSFSFGSDEAINHGKGENVTWQRNLIAESAKGMIMGNLEEDYSKFSFNQNVFFNVSHRFPNVQAKGPDARVDVINNLVWSYHSRMSRPRGNYKLNQIGNFYEYDPGDGETSTYRRWNHIQGAEHGYPEIFTDNNFHNLGVVADDAVDNYTALWFEGADGPNLPAQYQTMTMFPLLGEPFTILTADQTKSELQENVGANRILDGAGQVVSDVDVLDTKYLAHIKANEHTGWSHEGNSVSPHRTAYLANVGVTINTHPAGYDTDNDGMPDVWELATFGNLDTDETDDSDNDGYTNLEQYMNLVDY